MTVISPAGTEELTRAQCDDLLETGRFGRIAVRVGDGLEIFPVNYAYRSGYVAIRTNPGTKLAAAVQGDVAFEIDQVDESARIGWSVLVTGVAYDVTDAVDPVSEELRRLTVESWAPGANACWLRIEPRSVMGRAVGPTSHPDVLMEECLK